jgi:predicted amidohydrolase YtcJ
MAGDAPEAFACRGEWVEAAGSLAELRERFPQAAVRDFGPACIVPGFNDAHQHPTICAEQSLQVDLSPDRVANTTDVLAALRERAAAVPAGHWVVGFGYDPFRSNAGRELTRDDLDAIGTDHPVLVVHVTLHSGAVNSTGLRLAGFFGADDAPAGGVLVADPAGRLTGVVHDQALYDLAFPAFTRRQTVVPPPPTVDLQDALLGYLSRLHAAGITSVGDALVGPAGWELMRTLDKDGRLPIRVNALAAYDHFDRFRDIGQGDADPAARLRLGGVKTFADGAVNGGTCLVEQPVIGGTGHGIERMSAGDLARVVREIHDAGWRACVHANGDRAIRYVLDAVQAAQQANPRADVRHRIEHTSIVTPQLLDRMHHLGVVAVPFAAYARAHGDKLRAFYGPERIEWMFAHRAMLDRGIPVAGSSDYPCGPFEPLFAMQSCVTRTDRTGAAFGLSQRISVEEALGLYTTGAAYASGEEGTKGRLAVGYLADFAVLGADPLTTERDGLVDIPVLATYVGGTEVWAAH